MNAGLMDKDSWPRLGFYSNDSNSKSLNGGNKYDSNVSETFERKAGSDSWNKSSKTSNFATFYDKDEEEINKFLKNERSKNHKSSTLSLHISDYENLTGSDKFGVTNDLDASVKKQNKQHLNSASTFIFQKPFEFLKQQNDKLLEQEISQFKASHRLINPNETLKNVQQVDEITPPSPAFRDYKKVADE
uniref:Uncharacterized protein n=1 Tax=Panagrolaimus davidi TaxID=227884 RepID=A0A914QMW1_9BILA